MATAAEISAEYASSLSDLTFNSKPLINMLTMLADEYRDNANVIVTTIEQHLLKVRPDVKLPVLYLIDSIVKNVGVKYTQLFKANIASLFCGVFEKVDEKVRSNMFKLRSTWAGVFPEECLHQLDIGVNKIDRAWPIVSKPAPAPDTSIKETLLKKQKELLELQHKRLELELLQTKARLEEQQRQIEKQNSQIKQDAVKKFLPQLKGDVVKLLSSSNPDPEQTKKLKTKLAHLSAIAGTQHQSAVSQTSAPTVHPEVNDPPASESKASRSPGRKHRSSSTGGSSSSSTGGSSGSASVSSGGTATSGIVTSSGGAISVGGGGLVATASPAKPSAPFVNPFVKHNTPPTPNEVAVPPPPRISINPVSSDLVTAVAVRRTASGGTNAPAVRDPRLRRTETSSSSTPTTFTVTIGAKASELGLNDDLFGSETSDLRKPPKSPSKSSSRDRRDEPKRDDSRRDGKSERSDRKGSVERKERDTRSASSKSSKHSESDNRHSSRDTHHYRKSSSDRSGDRPSTKSRSGDDKYSKRSDNDKYTKDREKLPDLVKPLPKPSQLPPIPKLKKKTSDDGKQESNTTNSKSRDSTKYSKVKEATKEKSSEKKETDNSKAHKSDYSQLEETIRLKKKQIEEELKANAKNLQELNDKISRKEKYTLDDKSDKDEMNVEDVESLDDIIRMKKRDHKDVEPSRTDHEDMGRDNDSPDIDDIIRMRKQKNRIDKQELRKQVHAFKEDLAKDPVLAKKIHLHDNIMDVGNDFTNTDQVSKPVLTPREAEATQDKRDFQPVQDRNDENVHPNKESESEPKPTTPPKPRLFIKNIALLTKPPTPPSQDLEEISEDELVSEEAKNTIPITALLEAETDDESIDDSDRDQDLSPRGKFKELKASSLKRLRQFVRSRDQLTPSPPPPPSGQEMTARSSGEQSKHLAPRDVLCVTPTRRPWG